MASNPPSISDTWAEMENVLASGKAKVYYLGLPPPEIISPSLHRILVFLTSPGRRVFASFALLQELLGLCMSRLEPLLKTARVIPSVNQVE